MEEFLPYRVEYIKGCKMPADGLSRKGEVNSISSTSQISWEQLFKAQLSDHESKALVCWVKYKQLPHNELLKGIVDRYRKKVQLVNGVVCVKGQKVKPFAPVSFRPHLIRLAHDSALAGHFGVAKTLARLSDDWEWPKMATDVESHCHSCLVCGRNRTQVYHHAPLKPLPPTSFFNQRVHIDLMGPLPANSGNKYILVMIDAFSNLLGLAAIPDKTAETVCQAFIDQWVKVHGCPITINSDQGKEFVNHVFQFMCKQSNGRAERQVRQVVAYLRKYLETGENENNWEALLSPLQFAHNSSKHSTKGFSPFMIAFNRKPILPSSIMIPNMINYKESETADKLTLFSKITRDVVLNDESSFSTQKRQFDLRTRRRLFQVGDTVYVNRPKTGSQFQKFQPLHLGRHILINFCDLHLGARFSNLNPFPPSHARAPAITQLTAHLLVGPPLLTEQNQPPANPANPPAVPPPPPPIPPRPPPTPPRAQHTRSAGPVADFPNVMRRPIEFKHGQSGPRS